MKIFNSIRLAYFDEVINDQKIQDAISVRDRFNISADIEATPTQAKITPNGFAWNMQNLTDDDFSCTNEGICLTNKNATYADLEEINGMIVLRLGPAHSFYVISPTAGSRCFWDPKRKMMLYIENSLLDRFMNDDAFKAKVVAVADRAKPRDSIIIEESNK